MKVNKTFSEIYNDIPYYQGGAKTKFVNRIAEITFKSAITVRMWIMGRQAPDELVQSVISKELGIPAEILFPKDDTTKTKQP